MYQKGPKSYTLKNDRIIRGETLAIAGAVVFECQKYDYGSASEDTRMLGQRHISVTLDPTGDYPFFTVPVSDLEPSNAQ